jgi:hypothetical protein
MTCHIIAAFSLFLGAADDQDKTIIRKTGQEGADWARLPLDRPVFQY